MEYKEPEGGAVLRQVAGVVNAPGAQVHCHHHLGADVLAPDRKLVGAYLVGLQSTPGPVQPGGTAFPGTHPILPPVAGYEVAAGVADEGDMEGTNQVFYILPEAQSVCRGVLRAVDAVIHGSAQVLNRGAVYPVIHRGCLEAGVNVHGCFNIKSPHKSIRLIVWVIKFLYEGSLRIKIISLSSGAHRAPQVEAAGEKHPLGQAAAGFNLLQNQLGALPADVVKGRLHAGDGGGVYLGNVQVVIAEQ